MLGWAVARLVRLPQAFTGSLNWWVLNIALPALVLELIPRVHFEKQLWFLPVAMWLVFAGAWAFFAALGRMLGWSRARTGAVILAAGLGNTALVGFPLIEALRGKEGMALAVHHRSARLPDRAGGRRDHGRGDLSGGKPEPRVIAKRILYFPAFHAMILGFIVGALGGFPAELDAVFARIGATLTPVALFSIGAQFNLHLDRSRLGATASALGWKLALAPLVIYALGLAFGIEGLVLSVAVLQAAMAPMVFTAILADQYGLEKDVTSMALGAGILISLFSIPWMSQFLAGAGERRPVCAAICARSCTQLLQLRRLGGIGAGLRALDPLLHRRQQCRAISRLLANRSRYACLASSTRPRPRYASARYSVASG